MNCRFSLLVVVFVVASVALLFGCFDTNLRTDGYVTLRVINKTPSPLTQMHLSASESGAWGENILSAPVLPGTSQIFYDALRADKAYDMKCLLEDQDLPVTIKNLKGRDNHLVTLEISLEQGAYSFELRIGLER